MIKVLIAEDNLVLADILEEYLICQGYDVCGIARTVDQAVRLADLHQPDLAVLDYRMAHGEYGTEIGPRLKNKANMGILYASGDSLAHKLTIEDGAAYLQKPYSMNDLVHALQIVYAIKENKNFHTLRPPHNFHFLRSHAENHRRLS